MFNKVQKKQLKTIYERAVELLSETKSVGVYAPSMAWIDCYEKDLWLKALVEATDKKRTFLAGYYSYAQTEADRDRFHDRLSMLKDGGVRALTVPYQGRVKVGSIIYDDVILFNLGNPSITEYGETRDTGSVNLFRNQFSETVVDAERFLKRHE